MGLKIKRIVGVLLLGAFINGCDYYKELANCRDFFQGRAKGHFLTDESGLAKDQRTNTLWYRCAGGQRYSNFKCKGEPLKLSWDKAMEFSEEFSQKSGKSWKLPTKREMKSIMESECINPSVNPTVFPGLEVNNFWTASRSLDSDLFRCSVYTYRGDLFCRQTRITELPFLLVEGRAK